jgi:SAM-dependent methyltransferase
LPNNSDLEPRNYLKFDVISCLNLLDRCDKPFTLLKQIKNALVHNGLLVVALVLPFNPYVEYNKDNKPLENLLDADSFSSENLLANLYNNKNVTVQQGQCTKNNDSLNFACNKKTNKINYQISYLIENVFRPLGFEIIKFSRVPYLCEGNLLQSFYFMNDYIFVFKSL